MKILWLDFETYYDDEYSLRKITPAEYILDSRFETICVATKIDDGPIVNIDGPDFPRFIAQFDPRDTVTVTFNALFDNCILAWHYGFVPKRMIDVLGMCRALLAHKLPRLSLEKVALYLKVGEKQTTILKVKGKHRADIMADPDLWREFRDYADIDVFLMVGIYDKLAPEFPTSEYKVMDLVLRTAVCPRFYVDVPMLTKHLEEVRQEKENLLVGATLTGANGIGAVTKADVMSGPKFQQMLTNLGVEIEYKTSLTGNTVPAFAKTDEFMETLQNHEDTRVQALAACRLGLKSTLEETRSEKLLAVAGLNWPTGLGTMPIPLRYSGPHTHRLSGDWKMNMQNLPTGRGGTPDKPNTTKLRKSLIAPPGHDVIVADLGQIEARLTAWLAHADTLLQAFRDFDAGTGKDPYALLASYIFQMDVDPRVHKLERFIGKSGVLGLGFGAAAPKFHSMVVRSARSMDMDISSLNWTFALAEKSVSTYRTVNAPIPALWELLDHHLGGAWMGLHPSVKLGPVEIGPGYVRGPNGLEMRYVLPESGNYNRFERTYGWGGRWHRIYGAKFLENIIQFLARIILFNAACRLADKGLFFALQCHDELAFIVPKDQTQDAMVLINQEMTCPPSWGLDIPLKASVSFGVSYGDAK